MGPARTLPTSHAPERNKDSLLHLKILEYRTLTEVLMAAPPDRPFITMYRGDDDITTVTFGEFIQQARRQAASLLAEGVQPGDRVVLIMPQGIQVMATFAASNAGGRHSDDSGLSQFQN